MRINKTLGEFYPLNYFIFAQHEKIFHPTNHFWPFMASKHGSAQDEAIG